jgi:telomere length regulation protein
LLDGISREAIDREKEANADKVPNLVRERHLRIHKPAKISELRSGANDNKLLPQTFRHNRTFTDVAAEFFISPLINRFWLFLRNEQTREARTAHQEPLYHYKGAGTGLILNPMVLTHFLGTLAVLVHAAQNAPQWLAIVAPDALEFAVTLGTKPVSQMEDDDDDRHANNGKGKEASVLTTALELILVVLDGCLELDGGRSLGLEHTALLLGAGEWAGEVFSRLEKGARIEGGGGAQEVKLKRAAAGVLLKVDELTSRWRRSMVDVR